jgi:hypothetical protein
MGLWVRRDSLLSCHIVLDEDIQARTMTILFLVRDGTDHDLPGVGRSLYSAIGWELYGVVEPRGLYIAGIYAMAAILWLRSPSSLRVELRQFSYRPRALPRCRQADTDYAADHQKFIFALRNAG